VAEQQSISSASAQSTDESLRLFRMTGAAFSFLWLVSHRQPYIFCEPFPKPIAHWCDKLLSTGLYSSAYHIFEDVD
jgi:hypothetical protein